MGDQSLDLAAYLEELERQRAMLDIQISGIRQRLALGDSPPTSALPVPGLAAPTPRDAPSNGRIRSDEFFGMSIPEAIKHYLALMKQPQGPKAIVDGLQSGGLLTNARYFYANVTTALKRLRAAGQVVLTPNGWGLATWYSNRPRSVDDGRRGRKGKKRSKVPVKRRASGGVQAPAVAEQDGKAEGSKTANEYRAFVADQMKAGKTMTEAAKAWRTQKDDAS